MIFYGCAVCTVTKMMAVGDGGKRERCRRAEATEFKGPFLNKENWQITIRNSWMGQILGEKVDIRRMHAKHNLSFFVYLWPFLCSFLIPSLEVRCLMLSIIWPIFFSFFKSSAFKAPRSTSWPMAAGTYARTHHKSNQNIQCNGDPAASKHQNKSCQHWNLAFISFKIIRKS